MNWNNSKLKISIGDSPYDSHPCQLLPSTSLKSIDDYFAGWINNLSNQGAIIKLKIEKDDYNHRTAFRDVSINIKPKDKKIGINNDLSKISLNIGYNKDEIKKIEGQINKGKCRIIFDYWLKDKNDPFFPDRELFKKGENLEKKLEEVGDNFKDNKFIPENIFEWLSERDSEVKVDYYNNQHSIEFLSDLNISKGINIKKGFTNGFILERSFSSVYNDCNNRTNNLLDDARNSNYTIVFKKDGITFLDGNVAPRLFIRDPLFNSEVFSVSPSYELKKLTARAGKHNNVSFNLKGLDAARKVLGISNPKAKDLYAKYQNKINLLPAGAVDIKVTITDGDAECTYKEQGSPKLVKKNVSF